MEQAPPDLAATTPQHSKSSCKGFLLPVAKTKIYSEKETIMQACHCWQHAYSVG